LNHLNHVPLPIKITLQDKWGEIFDQGQLGSCVSNSVAGCVRFCCLKNNNIAFNPSRLFIYYNGRVLSGFDPSEDSGMAISDGFRSVNTYKVCTEANWPYDISKFSVKPLQCDYDEAVKLNSNIKDYSIDQDLTTLKQCIFEGYPISFGITLFDSFESNDVAQTGIVPMPDKFNEQQIGGHAITIVGYDDANQWFIVANSWGSSWGSNGFCFIPYQYVLDQELANDFWTIRLYTLNSPKKTIQSDIQSAIKNNDKLNEFIKTSIQAMINDQIKQYISDVTDEYIKNNS